ncbi:MAG: hypothetical protein WAU69_06760 [Solirubrobacteraceae bacterium]
MIAARTMGRQSARFRQEQKQLPVGYTLSLGTILDRVGRVGVCL